MGWGAPTSTPMGAREMLLLLLCEARNGVREGRPSSIQTPSESAAVGEGAQHRPTDDSFLPRRERERANPRPDRPTDRPPDSAVHTLLARSHSSSSAASSNSPSLSVRPSVRARLLWDLRRTEEARRRKGGVACLAAGWRRRRRRRWRRWRLCRSRGFGGAAAVSFLRGGARFLPPPLVRLLLLQLRFSHCNAPPPF